VALSSPDRLSVIIPALNEQATLARVLAAVLATGEAHEIIVVDDGSTDATASIIDQFVRDHPGRIQGLRHARPRGKGAAIRTGLARVSGDIVLVQDADLEYDPAEYTTLLAPFEDPHVQVVYGSRNLQRNPLSSFSFYWGGRLLSWVTNLLFHSRLTDQSTGYKLVRTPLLRSLSLQRDGFEFCSELTGKLLRRGISIHEVPISYRPRSFAEGKKIRWRDGWIAIGTLLQQRLQPRSAAAPVRAKGDIALADTLAGAWQHERP
jgi:glycosyltransferase involved in cell wall biosynthesis